MRIKIILFAFFFAGQCYAQQEAQFTMFWNNYSSFNPAATGLFNKHYASVSGRHQWVGFGEEPITVNAVYDFKWNKINSGIGINYLYDQLGFEKNNEINLNYSYQMNFKKDRILSSGVSFGLLKKSIDFSKFIPLNPNDPLLANSIKKDYFFNINVGFVFKTPHFLLGFSTTQINKTDSEILPFKNSRHYYLACSYNAMIRENFNFRPSILVKSDLASTQYDFNLITIYKKRVWAGFAYRITDAVAFMAGIDIKGKYRIGYSYDYTISKIANYSKGSHEIVLAFMTD